MSVVSFVTLGVCPDCQTPLLAPGFSEVPVDITCAVCDAAPEPPLAAARAHVRDAYAACDERALALILSANVGQFVTALLNGERGPAKAFLANAVALGEMILASRG